MTEYVRLGDVATINPPKKEVANLDDDTIVGFLPMDAVSNDGAIERIDTRKYAEVKKGFVYFRDGDVLFAKITPCMENGKGAVVSGMPDGIGFGSTEFHVVRPNEEIIYGQYIHYFLKNPALRKVLENEMTGSAGQKRVSKDTLKELAFPLPPLEEQKRIAAALDKMSSVIAKRKRQIALLDEAAKSLFVEMFGDPVENPMGWEEVPLSNTILSANNGMSRRGNNADGNIVLRLVELQEGFIDYKSPNRIKLTDSEKKKCLLNKDDVLFARVNGNPAYVGRCAVFKPINEPVYHNDHIIRICFNETMVNSTYISMYMNGNGGRLQLKDKVKTSAGQYTINQKDIGCSQIPLPPIELQNLFAARIEALEAQRASCERGLKQMETAFAAMMQEYFE